MVVFFIRSRSRCVCSSPRPPGLHFTPVCDTRKEKSAWQQPLPLHSPASGCSKAEKVSVFKGLQRRLPIFRHVSCRKVFWSEFLWHSCFLRVCTKECFSFIFYSKYSVRTSEFHTSENVCTLNWRLLILIWKRSDLNFMMFLVLGEIGLKAKV